MARIAGVDLPREKSIEIALTYIYGIGRTSAQKICDEAGVGRESNRPDHVGVSLEAPELLSRRRVPEARRLVEAARQDERAVGRKRDRGYGAVLSRKSPSLLAGRYVPDARQRAAGQHEPAVRGKRRGCWRLRDAQSEGRASGPPSGRGVGSRSFTKDS